MNENDDLVKNMVSNLPLLFANGYPTSLDKISEAQIQNFIPFMVQCSLGNINVPGREEYSEPEWWPEDIKFSIPLTKPKNFRGNWPQKLKEIVRICYHFHKSLFLLRFCNDLASYEHERLRFINNYNSTTSLYDRKSNKLLVTFRNENMTYDQPQKSRKCLLQQKSRSQNDSVQQQLMVEPPLFDIYLCDNCDAELYSLEAITEHEKTCSPVVEDDDDVILISENDEIMNKLESEEKSSENIVINSGEQNKQSDFLFLNFQLKSYDSTNRPNRAEIFSATKDVNETVFLSKKEKLIAAAIGRRNRNVYQFSRTATIPFSSPAGQLLIKTNKNTITDEYVEERLDRIDRFCSAIAVQTREESPGPVMRSRPLSIKRRSSAQIMCTFKKPQEYPIHIYKFPRRSYRSENRTQSVKFLNDLLAKRCRPISVRVRKIIEAEVIRKRKINSNLNIKLIRRQGDSGWKIRQKAQLVVDTIDLCSSDEETDSGNGSTGSTQINSFVPQIVLDEDSIDPQATHKQSKPELQNVITTFNSDITITPIRKILHSHPDNINFGISNSNINTSNSNNINNNNNNNSNNNNNNNNSNINNNSSNNNNNNDNDNELNQQKYEGNFLLSPQQVLNCGSSNAKPLQPSVFLFSNNFSTAPTTVLAMPQRSNQQSNQENFVDTTSPLLIASVSSPSFNNTNLSSNNNMDCTNLVITPSATRSTLNSTIRSKNKQNSTSKVLQNLNLMQHYDGVSISNKISSPNRTLSIDLTL